MTEDEARTKWCPMSRIIFDDEEGGVANLNRNGTDTFGLCIASGCMMWRLVSIGSDLGYCGLAPRR